MDVWQLHDRDITDETWLTYLTKVLYVTPPLPTLVKNAATGPTKQFGYFYRLAQHHDFIMSFSLVPVYTPQRLESVGCVCIEKLTGSTSCRWQYYLVGGTLATVQDIYDSVESHIETLAGHSAMKDLCVQHGSRTAVVWTSRESFHTKLHVCAIFADCRTIMLAFQPRPEQWELGSLKPPSATDFAALLDKISALQHKQRSKLNQLSLSVGYSLRAADLVENEATYAGRSFPSIRVLPSHPEESASIYTGMIRQLASRDELGVVLFIHVSEKTEAILEKVFNVAARLRDGNTQVGFIFVLSVSDSIATGSGGPLERMLNRIDQQGAAPTQPKDQFKAGVIVDSVDQWYAHACVGGTP